MTGKEIGLSQMFPYPGKRDHAVQIVTREKEQAEFELEEMRNMLRADVKMAYAELSYGARAGGRGAPESAPSSNRWWTFPARCSPWGRGGSPTSCGGRSSTRRCGRCS